MVDALNTSQTNSTEQETDALSFDNLHAETPAQKRALSYANTIFQLFHQVMDKQHPADRVVGEYFRINKKHGSKDRRVIRESVFALFRWWGWLSKFNVLQETEQKEQAWFTILTINAHLESHPWNDFISAWEAFSGIKQIKSVTQFNSAVQRCDWLSNQFDSLSFTTDELVPDWFWKVCPNDNTEQRLALIESLSSRPPIWGRVQNIDVHDAINTLTKLDIPATGSEFFSDSINLGNKNINLNGLALYKDGELEIQDLGSQVVGQICQPKADDNWWDTCSGAGGKSLQLRSLMLQQNKHATGTIVASDIRRKPLEELTKRAKRAGFKGITTAPWKSDELPVKHAHFDGVLVDAPCSCTGTWRRNPDMRWIDNLNAVMDKPALQLDILSRSSKAVKTGATLVYATCSLSPLENEAVVKAFLASNDDFSLEVTTHPFTSVQATMHTVMPYQADTDGMFVARMIRN
ncbi:RsmB/NOP family class I SAM-dependent RNA methyltransferase [Shewanella sp. D64]|uniref:RsmB/NOP family class I SAM-dependent RNA methyltransferase n=1 Tax=unclassified Shewanella TaxID=196818 RepID=UPI0022BA286B|nr:MULTISPECIES: RsmB/NOP family class I SAM-dependent RNA methyltransferase [unclassified Shewanella]MEC4726463.1 RsmB/NOP family class I SAM-dependent RNA methyltransferase [Shewanella sp. D64]MEC4738475.1 RsmB/NOP family class I SAM-dependent RNA methyltransferase [Shewanella sp. E94]WBJ94124.1 RsmB/NOP family class I SAM-dependent RNA methyltransferase [Shewanella sp. MTB7]